jgi:hypothetical protein
LNCLPTEILAHWFLLYIVGVTSSLHQREVTEISLALSVGEPLHEQSFPITVFNSFSITFTVFRYLKIRTIGHIGNFFFIFFYPRRGDRKRVTRTGLYRVTRRVASPGYQTGLNWVLERVSTGYRIELLGGSLDIKQVYRKGI